MDWAARSRNACLILFLLIETSGGAGPSGTIHGQKIGHICTARPTGSRGDAFTSPGVVMQTLLRVGVRVARAPVRGEINLVGQRLLGWLPLGRL